MDEIDSLEQQLRSLPQEAPPCGLLQRLLADIPAQRSSIWNRAPVALAAVLFIAATVSVFYPFHPNSAGHRDRAVSAEFVLHHSLNKQETDPCSILPPFPES
jgi:hypothetical protein